MVNSHQSKQSPSKDSELVQVRADKNYLRLQFSRSISQKIWSQKQKYLSLGLSDTPDNRKLARKIALEIQQDIRANKLDTSLESYLPTSSLKKEVGILYDPTEIKIPLLELYDLYCEAIEPRLCFTTFEHRYRGYYRRVLETSSQNVSDAVSIRNHLLKNRSQYKTCELLNALYEMIEWAREKNLIHPDTVNSFKKMKKGINSKPPKLKPPELVQSIPGYFADEDIKGFSREEAELIMDGFQALALEKPQLAYTFNYVRFLFWTGCRTGEATGLTWDKVASDCSYIIFEQSYDYQTRTIKQLKTAKDGTFARKFPCGTKLKELLEELKAKPHDPKGLVFTNSLGNPVAQNSMMPQWMGTNRRSRMGVVTKLVQAGKIRQYLKTYATRHTWITLQLEANVPVINVAKLAGNSPKVIYKYYESLHQNVTLAPEV